MAYEIDVPYRPQDRQAVASMVRALEESKGKSKIKGYSCKKTTFPVKGTQLSIDSWRFQDWDYKKPDLPTYARGLFTTKNANGQSEIIARGYDKFFNHGEVRETEWRNVETNTRGPYELSVKENGCIIFIAALDDDKIVVCSKHSLGARSDIQLSHAQAGETWVDRHLASVGKTRSQLATKLREMNATAVAELCDDEFEEHVLAYTPDKAGLYLHGINLNLPEFATYPHHLVDRFAEEWGFRKTQFLIKDDIKQVKTFLDKVAETGNYDGRDTEGFVIRCQSKANSGEWHDWFFKYKFEEPYLMYRQWRECTKALISGRDPKYRQHKKITEEYLLFARRQLHANPALGKAYQANHGIIKMRDDFLASRGLSGADIIRQEAQEGEVSDDAVSRDIVLVPIATLGCGKTTVALALCRLFEWGHIQNDNITVKKNRPQAFANACTSAMTIFNAIIADRNNSERRERKQIIEDISKIAPKARFVALHYVHERSNFDAIRQANRARVLSRGDNHQTIQAGSKDPNEIIHIMENFMRRFESLDAERSPDDGFDIVVDLDVLASSRDNLETIITRLYNEYPKLFADKEMPSSDDMDAAIHYALTGYTVEIKHTIKGPGSAPTSKIEPSTIPHHSAPKPHKTRPIEYFAAQLPATRVVSILDAIFQDAGSDAAKMYNLLKASHRIQPEFHVTLIHRSASTRHVEEWSRLKALHDSAATPSEGRTLPLPDPKFGACKVLLERIVWDTRVMAFVVRLSPIVPDATHFVSVNQTAHVTVGTARPDVKPKESNDMLTRWLQDGCTATNGIQEMAVKGVVELEATVRAVLSR